MNLKPGVSNVIERISEVESGSHLHPVISAPANGPLLSSAPRRVLLVEDVIEDAELVVRQLQRHGLVFEWLRVDTAKDLAPIVMGTPLLKLSVKDDSDRCLLEMMESSAQRGTALVKQILAFARGSRTETRPVRRSGLVCDLASMISQTFPRTIDLITDVSCDAPPVNANSDQIHQVLLNLCVNARDAMPAGGQLTLRLRTEIVGTNDLRLSSGAHGGIYVVIEVGDTGSGIPPGILEKIWEPFFTTKIDEGGTGLGLSTTRTIMDRHQGFLTLESTVGVGTTVYVFLPVDCSTVTAEAHSPPPRESPRGKGETILVVDDEPSILSLTHILLARAGYRSLSAVDGRQALELFNAHRDEIRLVVTDTNMPGMSGEQVVAALHAIQPGLPVLMCSGSAAKPIKGLTAEDMISKPFAGSLFLERIEQKLRPSPRARPATLARFAPASVSWGETPRGLSAVSTPFDALAG